MYKGANFHKACKFVCQNHANICLRNAAELNCLQSRLFWLETDHNALENKPTADDKAHVTLNGWNFLGLPANRQWWEA